MKGLLVVVALLVVGTAGFLVVQHQREEAEASREAESMRRGAEQFTRSLKFSDKPVYWGKEPSASPSPEGNGRPSPKKGQ